MRRRVRRAILSFSKGERRTTLVVFLYLVVGEEERKIRCKWYPLHFFSLSVVVSDRKGFFFGFCLGCFDAPTFWPAKQVDTGSERAQPPTTSYIKRTYLTRSVVFIFIFTFILNVHLEVLGDSEVSGAVSPYIPLAVSLVDQPFESTFFFDLT